MKKETKEKYLKIYYDCLEKKYNDPSINELNDVLYQIIFRVEKNLKNSVMAKMLNNDHINDDTRVEQVFQLIKLFRKIVKDNRQNEVKGALRLIVSLSKINAYEILHYLMAFFYPKEAYLDPRCERRYHLLIENMITDYVFKEINGYTFIDKKYYDVLKPDMRKVLDIYKYYFENTSMKDLYDRNCISKFYKYIRFVITYYYKEKCDVSLFPTILDYLYLYCEYVDEAVELNYSDFSCAEEDIIYKVLMDCLSKNSPIIK